MAGFDNKSYIKFDTYMTPKYVWTDIKQYIPNDKIIWECFYGDGKSGTYLQELGFNVIHDQDDFFLNNKGDIVVSNPPFSQCQSILTRLKQIDKPFILILPSSKINTQYFRNIFCNDNNLQIIIPKKRIQFNKMKDGKIEKSTNANFDCFYYCWKMNLDKDITWLL